MSRGQRKLSVKRFDGFKLPWRVTYPRSSRTTGSRKFETWDEAMDFACRKAKSLAGQIPTYWEMR